MARARKNWSKYLDLLFRDAALTLRVMPGTGCKPAGYQSAQPAPVRNWWEAYGQEPASRGKARHALSRAAISRLDFALVLIGGAQLTALQRNIVWDRASRLFWKQIAAKYSRSETIVRRHHANALAEICAYAIARHKKSLSGMKFRHRGKQPVEFRNAA
jgi:hypothetical protein